MFRSALAKLTLAYLLIIMVLSLGFSIAIYQLSSNEINRGFRNESAYIMGPLSGGPGGFFELRQREVNASQARLRLNLLLLNLLTLGVGGGASHYLAKRTLRPIERAMEAQSRFTADASHELRTPLTAIQTENEVALRNSNLSIGDARSQLQSNLEEVAKLRALSEGLLRLARRDGDDLEMAPVAVNQLVADAVERVASQLERADMELRDDTTDIKVQGDRTSLVELLVILLENAVKYSKAGTTIEFSNQRHGSSIYIGIKDHGVGIRAEDAPHVFERFYRADHARGKSDAGGYGLGLSIAEQIVRAHGGRIDMESVLGSGTTFTVVLPAASVSV